jgi:hypothetical protein
VPLAALRVATYRFRATFGRRWGGYLALVILIGLVGGLSMASVAGARRTQSSFPTYLASTGPADLEGITSFVNSMSGAGGQGYDPALMAKIAHLPHVTQFTYFAGLNIVPLSRRGIPESPTAFPAEAGNATGLGNNLSSRGGGSVVQGRIFNPGRTDEFVVTPAIARIFRWHVGEVVSFGAYTNGQAALRSFGTPRLRPHESFHATLTGIVVQSQAVVEDQVDAPDNANLLLFTPALTRTLLSCCTYYTGSAVKVGNGEVPTVAKEILHVLPGGFGPFATNPGPAIEAKAERAIKPESIALGVFGGIAGLAVLLIATQLIGRQLRLGGDDLHILRALGASPGMTESDGLIGIGGAVLAGAVLALAVAIGLSPLAPLGPVRPVYPTPGVAFDWPVFAVGFAVLVVGLSASTLLLAYRTTPHRVSRREQHRRVQPAGLTAMVASSGLPPTAVTGVRFALEPGAGKGAVPIRSAMLGAALALIVGIATVTFGSSLNSLVSHPHLYGWNWNYELSAGEGGVIPGAHATRLLNHDRDIAQWSSVDFSTLRFGKHGQPVPVIAQEPRAKVAPPLLSGHQVEGPGQVVVGAITLSQLHKHVGDLVEVRTGVGKPVMLRIVGTATLPTIGVAGNQHPEMGTGAIVAAQVLPAHSNQGYQLSGAAPGPDAMLVRLKSGESAAGLRSLRRIARATSTPADYGISVLSVQRPAEIVNYRSMGTTPAILGAGLAIGAVVALGLTLVASVRRRRRELALLKSLGFTARQLSSVVAWQATVAVAVGTVVGVPLGIVLGRFLWNLFAHELSVVPSPTVPVWAVVATALGAIVIGNVVAAVPARMASRTPTALLLRAE